MRSGSRRAIGAFGIAGVHAKQLRGKEGGLVATVRRPNSTMTLFSSFGSRGRRSTRSRSTTSASMTLALVDQLIRHLAQLWISFSHASAGHSRALRECYAILGKRRQPASTATARGPAAGTRWIGGNFWFRPLGLDLIETALELIEPQLEGHCVSWSGACPREPRPWWGSVAARDRGSWRGFLAVGLERLAHRRDGDFDHRIVGRQGRDALQPDAWQEQPADPPLVPVAGAERRISYAIEAMTGMSRIRPTMLTSRLGPRQAEQQDRQDDEDDQELCAAARMSGRVVADVVYVERVFVLERVDGHVLRAVIAEDAPISADRLRSAGSRRRLRLGSGLRPGARRVPGQRPAPPAS